MKKLAVSAAIAAAAVIVVVPRALAHHSFAVVYLEQDTIEIEGDVVEFQYKNPHAWVFVEGTEKGGFGNTKTYAAEWVSVSQLDRMNIDKKWFKAGDRVRVWASPNKNPSDNRVRLKRIERSSDGWKWAGNRGEVR